MPDPISTRAHGVIDYAWIAAARALARAVENATQTARLVRNASTAAGLVSMTTDYEMGIVRLIPMRAHLALDYALCAVLLVSPLFLRRAERRAAVVPVALGVAGVVTALLTRRDAFGARRAFTPSRDMSEAVADPDVARTPRLLSYAE